MIIRIISLDNDYTNLSCIRVMISSTILGMCSRADERWFQKVHMSCSHVVAACEKHAHHEYKNYMNLVYMLESVSNIIAWDFTLFNQRGREVVTMITSDQVYTQVLNKATKS